MSRVAHSVSMEGVTAGAWGCTGRRGDRCQGVGNGSGPWFRLKRMRVPAGFEPAQGRPTFRDAAGCDPATVLGSANAAGYQTAPRRLTKLQGQSPPLLGWHRPRIRRLPDRCPLKGLPGSRGTAIGRCHWEIRAGHLRGLRWRGERHPVRRLRSPIGSLEHPPVARMLIKVGAVSLPYTLSRSRPAGLVKQHHRIILRRRLDRLPRAHRQPATTISHIAHPDRPMATTQRTSVVVMRPPTAGAAIRAGGCRRDR